MSMKMMNAAYLVDNVALLSLQEKQDGVEFHCFAGQQGADCRGTHWLGCVG